jgi:RHS repeat-associated protein
LILRPPATHYLGYDGHGSTRILTDGSGAVASGGRYNYDAYGVSLGQTFGASHSPLTALLYSGEQFDTDLQQYYLRARYYNQSTGRFSQLDPYGGVGFDPQSLHKYEYAHNNPVDNLDPSGQSIVELLSSTVIRVLLFSLIVGAIFTAIQYGRGIRGWNLISAFLISSGTTLGIIAGGLSSVMWLSALATFAGYALLAYAVWHYGTKIKNGTFDRWDAAEILLFLLSWSVAKNGLLPERPAAPAPAAEKYVVLQHGTSRSAGEAIVKDRAYASKFLVSGANRRDPNPR